MFPMPPSLVSRSMLLAAAALSIHCGPQAEITWCSASGPPCGLTVDYEGGNLEVGTYAITIDTPAGVTSCDHVVEAPRQQTEDEALKQDEALLACGQNDTCPEPCSGPDDVIVRTGSLTVGGDAVDVTITIENVETGAMAEASFTPTYEDHPEECADCVTASATLPLPSG